MPAVPAPMRMFGSFQKLVSILYRINGFDVTLKPHATVLPSADRVIELPAVDLDCVLLSRGEADADYQPLDVKLTQLVDVASTGFVGQNSSGEIVNYPLTAYSGGGLSSADAGNEVIIQLSFDNVTAAAASETDVIMFGKVADGFVTLTKKLSIADLGALIGPGAYGYAETWDNETTSIVITHNLGTLDVMVQLYDLASNDSIMIDQMYRVDGNNIQLLASEAPPAGTGWRVLVQKIA